MVLQLLIALGMTRGSAQRLVAAPLIAMPLPTDSLLVRTHPAASAAKRRAASRRSR